jgi:hypothetical protein
MIERRPGRGFDVSNVVKGRSVPERPFQGRTTVGDLQLNKMAGTKVSEKADLTEKLVNIFVNPDHKIADRSNSGGHVWNDHSLYDRNPKRPPVTLRPHDSR